MAVATVDVAQGGRMSEQACRFMCGGVAGCLAKTSTAPFARLSVLAQTTTSTDAFSGGGLRQIWGEIRNTEGLGGLWKGNFLTCVHRFPYTGANFWVVESAYSAFPQYFRRNDWTSLVPGMAAGAAGVMLCYPLEVARTRVMATTGSNHSGLQAWKRILTDGPVKTYRGVGVALSVAVPSVGISFAVYEYLLDREHPSEYPKAKTFVAGGLSAIVASTLTFPGDVLRKRLQVMGTKPGMDRRSWVAESKHLWRNGGWRPFFRGLGPELVKVFPSVAITFLAFETLYSAVSGA